MLQAGALCLGTLYKSRSHTAPGRALINVDLDALALADCTRTTRLAHACGRAQPRGGCRAGTPGGMYGAVGACASLLDLARAAAGGQATTVNVIRPRIGDLGLLLAPSHMR